MIAVIAVCLTVLVLQFRHHEHVNFTVSGKRLLWQVEERVSALERKDRTEINQSEWDEFKNKVEALRIAQGIRGMR